MSNGINSDIMICDVNCFFKTPFTAPQKKKLKKQAQFLFLGSSSSDMYSLFF